MFLVVISSASCINVASQKCDYLRRISSNVNVGWSRQDSNILRRHIRSLMLKGLNP